MSKYDFELDLKNENSLSLIINMIQENSRILEFGPANGRMTKYLTNKMKCIVDIVEVDENAGREASKYSNKSLVGIEKGDIEKFYWANEFECEAYDYIIFADVLEHLHNPKKVLEKCNKLLKKDGSIILSVPNIAHNSVIIDLINDEFKYNEIGLLDNTHISFFTYKSLLRMIEECGYEAVIENGTYSRVGRNEIVNSYASVGRELGKKLRERVRGNVYQYIFEVKKKENVSNVSKLKPINLDINYEFVCYVKENTDTGFTEDKTTRMSIHPDYNNLQLDLTKFKDIQQLRIDPIDTNCIIEINNIYTIINHEKIEINILNTNGMHLYDNVFIFSNEDPQIYIDTNDLQIGKLFIEFKLIDYDLDNIGEYQLIMKDAIYKKENIIEEKENVIEKKESIIEERENYIQIVVNELECYKAKYNDLIEQKNDLSNRLTNMKVMYNEIINSTSWKITKPIRKMLDLIKKVK